MTKSNCIDNKKHINCISHYKVITKWHISVHKLSQNVNIRHNQSLTHKSTICYNITLYMFFLQDFMNLRHTPSFESCHVAVVSCVKVPLSCYVNVIGWSESEPKPIIGF